MFGLITLPLRRPSLTLGFGILAYWKWDTVTLPALEAVYTFTHPLALVALEQIKQAVKWVADTEVRDVVLRLAAGGKRSVVRFLWMVRDGIGGWA